MKKTHSNRLKKFVLMITVVTFSPLLIAADSAAGKAIYDGKGACATCHGATGAGDGVAAAALNPKPTNFTTASYRLDTDGDGQPGSDTDIANTIKYGTAKYGGSAGMPARADFSADEVNNLVVYLRSLKK
jgi:mono/diheme cytochrome c family protein